MQLRSSPPSPFGRKVKIVAKQLGLYDQIEVVASDTNNPEDSLRAQNPLGKIPILILEDGATLYDSRVIIEYLDSIAEGSVIPAEGTARFEALKLQAIADGMMDASILRVYEARFRPEEMQFQPWVDYQAEKVTRVLDHLDATPPSLDGGIHVGHIALACALSYLDLRFEGAWRQSYPKLVAWLDAFAAQVPGFAQTAIPS